MVKCNICNKTYEKLGPLHSHLKREHSLSQESYYYFWYPRLDLGDGSQINYKNFEQYFVTNFNSRLSLEEWVKTETDLDLIKDYIKEELLRKFNKGYKFYPSQAEIKSLMLPSYPWIFRIFGGAEKFFLETEYIGLKNKFNYSNLELTIDNSDMEIIMDSREQRPLFLKSEVRVGKLPVGDYCCAGSMYSNVYIERKSLSDLAGTLTSGLERFEREIQKAIELGLYIVVLCDESHRDCMDYSPSNSFAKKVTGAHIFHQIRHLSQKYKNIQFVFCSDRGLARDLTKKIFRLGELVKRLDIELLKDLKKI